MAVLVFFLPFTLSKSHQLSLQNRAEPLWCHHPYLSLLGSILTCPSFLLSGLPASYLAPRGSILTATRDVLSTFISSWPTPLTQGGGSHRHLRVLMVCPYLPHLLTTSPPVLTFSHFPPSCSSSEKWKWKSLSHVLLFATPWTVQSMEFSRPEYWSG